MSDELESCIAANRATCEAGSWEFCRDFIDVVEGILSNSGTMLHAGDRAIVITISEKHVKLKFWDNIADVSREW